MQQAMLVGILLPGISEEDNDESLVELGRLVKTLGFRVVGTTSQRRSSLTGPTVVGEGKLKEIARQTGGTGVVPRKSFAKKSKAALKFDAHEDEPEFGVIETGMEEADGAGDEVEVPAESIEPIDALIFDCELTPSQIVNLEKATGVEVLDRTGVIVEIFSRHARTREAKLQVEMARLKYLAPRLRHAGKRDTDRMGMAGESSLELDRRKIRDRLSELRDEIALVQKERAEGRWARSQENTVALVGYTNAGKSSLMRALTASEVLVEDKLFATLDTTVRQMTPPSIPPILISDTVGFIKKLPHDLVASFRSTLEEARDASLLLYVVDAADPSFRAQLAVTHEVLSSIGVEDVPSRLVLNKCDKLSPAEIDKLRREFPDALAMSAKRPDDVKMLRERLIEFFETGMVEAELFIPYALQKAVGVLRSQVRVLAETHTDEGTRLRVRAEANHLAALKKKLGL
jgi:GTP-binding protein HflX